MKKYLVIAYLCFWPRVVAIQHYFDATNRLRMRAL